MRKKTHTKKEKNTQKSKEKKVKPEHTMKNSKKNWYKECSYCGNMLMGNKSNFLVWNLFNKTVPVDKKSTL